MNLRTTVKIMTLAISAVLSIGVTSAFALDRHVVVENRTGFDIQELYASSVGSNSWEEDVLGRNVLASGSSVRFNVDDGTGYCKYDFRAVFSDGDVVEKGGVNVCEVGTFTFQ
jgi:hypothetical protein